MTDAGGDRQRDEEVPRQEEDVRVADVVGEREYVEIT